MISTVSKSKVAIGSKWHLPESMPHMALERRPWVGRIEGVFIVRRRDVCRLGGVDFINVVLQLDDGKASGDYDARYAYVPETILIEQGECLA